MYFSTGQSYLFTLYLKYSIIHFNVTIIFTSTSKICGRFALRVDLPQVPMTNNTLQHRLLKGLCMCAILISVRANVFSRLAFSEELLFHRPWDAEKAIIPVFKSYLVHFGSFKRHILYFGQALSRKFEVIEEKCRKPCSLLSIPQTDQVWRVTWSSGFHFCVLSSPVNDLPFPDSS